MSTSNKSGYVSYFKMCRHLTLWLVKFAKPVKSFIRDIDTCLIWFNGTEREVLSWDCQLCYNVKES
uniref:GTP-binding protein PTD004 n=1 Tax=Arundo donax TaxID=35708 RepID=A0A0A9CWJ7_ARUDO